MMQAMRSVILHALVHLCSVLLVLPTGWCCRVLSSVKPKDEINPVCCCCCQEAVKPAQEPAAPTPPPMTCCEQKPQQAKATEDVVADPREVAALLPLLDRDAGPAQGVHVPHRVEPAPGAAAPLHVLHCVWMC